LTGFGAGAILVPNQRGIRYGLAPAIRKAALNKYLGLLFTDVLLTQSKPPNGLALLTRPDLYTALARVTHVLRYDVPHQLRTSQRAANYRLRESCWDIASEVELWDQLLGLPSPDGRRVPAFDESRTLTSVCLIRNPLKSV
jgi:hypothetical protein